MGRNRGSMAEIERDFLHGRGRSDSVERRLHYGLDVDRPQLDLHFARDDPRHIQKILDQLDLCRGVPENGVGRFARRLGVELTVLQHPGPPEHGIEGRAQLVRKRCQELVLAAVDCFSLGAGLLLTSEGRAALPLHGPGILLQALPLRDVARDLGRADDPVLRIPHR